jgi:SAM-dependent methyltransferase
VPEEDSAISHDHTLKWVLSDHMDLGETPEPDPQPPPPQAKFIVRDTTPTIVTVPKGAKTPPPFIYTLVETAAQPVTGTAAAAPASPVGGAPAALQSRPVAMTPTPAFSAASSAASVSVAFPPVALPINPALTESTPAPLVTQPAALHGSAHSDVVLIQNTPTPGLPTTTELEAMDERPAAAAVADAYLDLGPTPADFFSAGPTPAPGQAAGEDANAAIPSVPSPPYGSEASEIAAESVELLPVAADESVTPALAPPAAIQSDPEGSVAPTIVAEAVDSQGLDAREVEPEAVMIMADSSEHTLDAPGAYPQPPTTPTPPPVPPEAAMTAPSRAAITEKPSTAPVPTPLPEILAATLFEEYQTPASAADDIPEALARRSLQKRSKPWYEEVFDDDYLRTVPFMTPDQTAREVDFIRDSLALKPGCEILDVACGYGRHAVELAQQGYRVTGLDLSLPLLIKAADHAQKRGLSVNFVHADMREMDFNAQFDAAYCVLSSFGYFDEETNLRVATAACHSLKPGGRFILDIINRDYIVGDLPSRVWWEGDGCVILEEVDFNYHTSRVLIRRSVVFGNGRQSEQEISMRAYSLHEVGRLLRQAGLRVLDVSGGMATKSRFFGAASRSIIALCERPLP